MEDNLFPQHLDKIDLLIIHTLRQNGRIAFAHIAQQLKVSPGMIRMRYNRLIERGILRVVAITNPLRMGMKTMAMIGICVDGSKLLEVADKIAALDEVIYLVITTGAYDIMAEVVCRDHAHLLQFLAEHLYQVDGVHHTESFIRLKIVKGVHS